MAYYFAGYNFYKIINNIKYFNDIDRFWLSSIFLIVPINFARISIANFQYALSYCLFFYAMKLLLERASNNRGLRLISLILFFISFHTNSLLLFYSIPIFYFWYSKYYSTERIKSIFYFIKKNIDLIILPFFYWIVKKIYFPAHGLFEGYNKIELTNILMSPIKSLGAFDYLIKNVFSFNHINIIIFIILFLFIYNITKSKKSEHNKENNKFIFIGFILFYFAVAPYLFVGRGYEYGLEWGGRDQLLIPLSVAFIFYFTLKLILYTLFDSIKNINLFMSLLIAIFLNVNISNYLDFNLDWFKQLSLINKISKSEEIKSNSNIIFKDNTKNLNGLSRSFRFYEYNGFFKLAFNNEKRLGIPLNEYSVNFPQNFVKYLNYPEYNFTEYDLSNPTPLFVEINSGVYSPTKRGILKLMAMRIFDMKKFNEYLNQLVTLNYKLNDNSIN